MKNCWIIGASSGIGLELAKKYYSAGWNVIISARRIENLNNIQQEISVNKNLGNQIEVFAFDVVDYNNFEISTQVILKKFTKIDLVIFAPAIYNQMNLHDFDYKLALEILNVNLVSALNFLDIVGKKMIKQNSGHIAVIASVAGYRGLPKSFAYGASKAGLINLFEGIYPELSANKIDLSIINPGFVATDLTAKNKFKMPFLISANKASEYIFEGLERKDFEIHFPKKFTFFMKFLRHLPNKFYLKFINYIYNKEK